MKTRITFEEALADDDWGLIIGEDGSLKGLFIPHGANEDDVPECIIRLCVTQFGIDPEEFSDKTLDLDMPSGTIH
jgi:hypothetical protein